LPGKGEKEKRTGSIIEGRQLKPKPCLKTGDPKKPMFCDVNAKKKRKTLSQPSSAPELNRRDQIPHKRERKKRFPSTGKKARKKNAHKKR